MKDFFKKMKNEITKAFQTMDHPPNPRMKEQQIDTMKLIWDCALMMEKYNFTVFAKNEDIATSFEKEDMKIWKEVYYPKLIRTNIISDTNFYDPLKINPNLGVGANGSFTRHEYCNLRYQLYLYIYKEYIQNKVAKSLLLTAPLHSCLANACAMIISYIPHAKPNNLNELYKFSSEDMKLWKKLFYPVLVGTSLLNDYSFIDSKTYHKKYGIGIDGVATCWELQHFVSEAYRFLLLPIYIEMNYALYE